MDANKTSLCLNKKIALSSCEAINIEGSSSVKNVLSGGYIRSNDKDPEVLINIVFQENVNLNGLSIEAPNEEKRPDMLMIFINTPNLNIGDVESLKPLETIVLNETNLGKKISLKVAKFRNVSSLNLYLTNKELDQIQVNNIQVYGAEGEKMDFKEIKNVNI